MYAIGIDIGGTSFKIGLVDEEGKIIKKYSFLVKHNVDQKEFVKRLGTSINEFLIEEKISKKQIAGIGIGCPGSIDSIKGVCDYSCNLQWFGMPVCEIVSNETSLPCKMSNDANVACLGESKFGSGKEYDNIILLTLGTGVGGGIVINKQLYEGKDGKGAELGHDVIKLNGRKCSCGRKGCLEAYASATALISDTKKAMMKHKDSLMWEYVENDIEKTDGKTAFECEKKGDKAAKKVVDDYIFYLGEGILNFCNVFRPDVILLGGGVAYQKENLTSRLEKYIAKRNFGYQGTPKVEVKCARLGNDAGIIGAAALFL